MNPFIIATGALLALATASHAADLPSRKTAPAPAPAAELVQKWSGFYAGLTAGYGWSSNKTDANYGTTGNSLFNSGMSAGIDAGLLPLSIGSSNNGSLTGGATIGYNAQYGSAVYGLEADLASMKRNSSNFSTTLAVSPADLASAIGTKGSLNWLGTLRGRAGMTFSNLLVYATGGLAIGGAHSSAGGDVTGTIMTVPFSATLAGSKSETRYGWALGGGVEYAINRDWSLKTEYLHYDLGKMSYALNGGGSFLGAATISGASARTQINGNLVRAGLNYRF